MQLCILFGMSAYGYWNLIAMEKGAVKVIKFVVIYMEGYFYWTILYKCLNKINFCFYQLLYLPGQFNKVTNQVRASSNYYLDIQFF